MTTQFVYKLKNTQFECVALYVSYINYGNKRFKFVFCFVQETMFEWPRLMVSIH